LAKEKKISREKEEEQKAYNEYVKEVTPTHSLPKNMAKAFFVGGIICIVGQGILQYCGSIGLDKDTSGSWCSLILVLLSVVLTGFNIYPKLATFGGAGALVPPGKIIPPGSLVMGVPGKAVRQVTEAEQAETLENAAHYVHLGREQLQAIQTAHEEKTP